MPPSGLENKYWELIRTHGSAHMGYPNAALWAREGKPKTDNWHSAFGTRLRRTAKIQTKDPSTPVSRAGESAREPSCAQDAERARGQVTGDREQEKSGDRAIGSSGEVNGHKTSTRHSALGYQLRRTTNTKTQDPSTPVSAPQGTNTGFLGTPHLPRWSSQNQTQDPENQHSALGTQLSAKAKPQQIPR